MKPIEFKESNIYLSKPSNMTEEECGSLRIFTDGKQCISCWRGDWKDRLKFLFTGKVWLKVVSGNNQPPVYVGSEYPFDQVNYKIQKGIDWVNRKLFVVKEKWSYYTGW